MENTEREINEGSVTFSTKCWENDWRVLLKYGFLKKMILRNDFDFSERILVINNVRDKKQVSIFAEINKQEGVIDEYFFVDEYAEQVLEYFGIKRDSFIENEKDGYVYSICELFEIFYSKTDYLVHFSGDTILERKYNWINQAKKIFLDQKDISIVNPCWNRKYHEAKNESQGERSGYFISKGYFSDQCYMLKLSEFKSRIFNEQHPFSERYPRYAGNLFEKRVDAWMRNNGKKRATLKDISYIHRNWGWLNKLKYRIFKKNY